MHRILFAALLALIGFAAPASAQQADIACTSIRDARMECPLNGEVEEIRLLRQTSEARCVLDRTWGVSRRKLWVDRGCAGVFRVFYVVASQQPPASAEGQIVACSSNNHRIERCLIPREAKWIRVRNRTSDTACTWRNTWATETGAIWVDRGCAARFELSFSRRAPGGGDWHEIASGGGRPATPPPPTPRPNGGYGDGYGSNGHGGNGHGGGYGDDRRDRQQARAAIRLCRRYGEDRPDLFNARWVQARPASTFRADRRGPDMLVEGGYDVIRRGPDAAMGATCRVRGDRILGFSVR
ncbi:MAG: hypothetical protein ACJAVR_002243 [Paracoccaceae bacterium]|jgi:hypothetical protein